MTKKLIAKTPIGYAGHLLSRGDNVREYIHDEEFIKLLIEGGHAEEVEVDEQLEVEQPAAEDPEQPAPEAPEAPAAEEPAAGKKKNEKLQ
ncbi:hypothetical protein PAALTS15_09885 [Paenibacillus alvei TS-15]|uniref:Uncharacterized protein n=1 Tax=Paenibacillus alvei TS-15 TaxID=1117108 RepID=S9TYY0_PAEAL|nr:hypothetical protein [Paenibacillus alvei]EPY07426.1 hypothetical protein PAALTS15_09885 [Paenibacillus alvei TS-15]